MNDVNWLLIIGIVVAGAAAIFLLGGEEPAPTVQALLLSPTVDAGRDMMLDECGSVRVGCEGFDPAGGPVSYQWRATAGSFDYPHSLHPLYTAPSTCSMEEVTLTLTVTNKQNVIAQDSLVVCVTDSTPCGAHVICPAIIPCVTSSGNVVRPPVPTRIVVRQVQSCVPTPVHCPLPVRVEVRQQCQNPCPIPCPERRTPLVTTCSAVCSAEFVVEGGAIQLRGTVWDIDRNLTSYYWTADKGRFDDPSAINPVYCAPMTSTPCGEDVRISLNVVDSCGARTASHIILRIKNVN